MLTAASPKRAFCQPATHAGFEIRRGIRTVANLRYAVHDTDAVGRCQAPQLVRGFSRTTVPTGDRSAPPRHAVEPEPAWFEGRRGRPATGLQLRTRRVKRRKAMQPWAVVPRVLALETYADAGLHADLIGGDFTSGDPRLPGGGRDQGGEHADRGGLARTVCAEQPEELTSIDRHVQPLDGDKVALCPLVDLARALRPDGRRIAGRGGCRGNRPWMDRWCADRTGRRDAW